MASSTMRQPTGNSCRSLATVVESGNLISFFIAAHTIHFKGLFFNIKPTDILSLKRKFHFKILIKITDFHFLTPPEAYRFPLVGY
jgi:hypothetical protein